MTRNDLETFATAWVMCAEFYDKQPSQGSIQLAFQLLESFTIEQVQQGLKNHMTDPDRGRFMPKPADVIAQIEATSTDGFPSADEAWALVPKNEMDSACVFRELMTAYGVAEELDSIAARMAFKGRYEREVSIAKSQGRKKPKWFITQGTDRYMRGQVTLDALQNGLIQIEHAATLLPHIPEGDLHRVQGQLISTTKCLENNAATIEAVDQLLLSAPMADADTARAHIAQLKQILKG